MENSEITPEGSSDLDILEGDEQEQEETTPPESESDESTEEEETPEDTDEEEKVEETEEDEIPEYTGRFAPKELKAKFPTIFKEFPGLRGIIAQENEFSKVFPTIEEAREAGEIVSNVRKLESDLLSGNSRLLLTGIAEAGDKTLDKFASNFLPTLQEINPALFAKTVIPYVNNVLREAKGAALKTKNKDLFYAVQHLSNFIHDDPDIPDDRAKDPEVEKEKNELERQKGEFQAGKLKEFKQDTYRAAGDGISRLIDKGLDPENVLSEKQKAAAKRDIFDELDAIIRKDDRFMGTIRSMIKQAEQSGLSREASDKIRLAYLARVKPLLSSVRQEVVAEYLPKNLRKPASMKKHIPSGGEGSSKPGKIDPSKVDWNKTSDMDILNDKVTFRK